MRRRRGRILDLSYANPVLELEPRVRAALVEAASTLPASGLQYSPYGGATKARRLVATDLARRTGLPFAYRDVILTAGATAALTVLAAAAFAPGDEVVLLRPSWFDYPLYLRELGIVARFVELSASKRLDADALAAAIGPSTAGMIISQPQSPTGVVLSTSELHALAEVLADGSRRTGRDLLLVSDEAHRDTEWAGECVHSPLEVHPHTAIVYSFGKAWRMQGMRIGYAAISPSSPLRAELAAGLVERVRAMGFGCPNTLMQDVAVRLLGQSPDVAWVREAQSFVRDRLRDSGYEVVDAAATTFVYARAPGGDAWRFVDRLARRGVLALPSPLCHEDGHFRLALNVGRRELEPAAVALSETLGAP